MAQQSSTAFFDTANAGTEFSVVLRGYDRPQVDDYVGRLNAALAQAEQARAEAEQRLAEGQRRLRQAEQRLTTVEQKLTDTNKQLEESSRPTLSGLGTRVEQILRLAEEQANDHRGESKREAEGIISGPEAGGPRDHRQGARRGRRDEGDRRARSGQPPHRRRARGRRGPRAGPPRGRHAARRTPTATPSSCAPRPRTRSPS